MSDFGPPPPAGSRPLAAGEIHLWAVSLAGSPERRASLEEVLSADERERARRFRFDLHRNRFIQARGALRRILAEYAGEAPEALRFHYGHRGKPDLAIHPDLHFNLSHSEELALLGVTRIAPLGVDVEQLRPLDDLEAIARRFFSRPEHERLTGLPETQWREGFFNCWTRKEAYIKAVGEGLAIPLDRFEVSLVPGEAARFLSFRDERESPSRWSLRHLRPAAGYVGAVALAAEVGDLRRWSWPG